MSPLFRGGSDDRSPRHRWTDRVVGILVGVVLGIGVLVYFVFVHSEGTIDAPSIKGGESTQSATTGEGEANSTLPAHPGSPEQPAKQKPERKSKPVPVVKVIGGAPPTGAGPKQLTFHKGEKVAFEIETDEPFTFEIRGLNITQSIESSSIIGFKATKKGQFPVISTATLIGVADLLIKPKK